jgi:hypothetical protein
MRSPFGTEWSARTHSARRYRRADGSLSGTAHRVFRRWANPNSEGIELLDFIGRDFEDIIRLNTMPSSIRPRKESAGYPWKIEFRRILGHRLL